MEVPARGTGIPQPASAGGTLLTPSSPPSASAAGDTSMLGHDNQTSDGSTLKHFGSHSTEEARDTLHARSATPARPGTPRDGSGDVYSRNPSPNNPWLQPVASKMEAPAEMPVASPSRFPHGCGDSREKLAADDQPGTSVSHGPIRHSEEDIRYLGQGPMNLNSRHTNPGSQESRSSAQGRSLQNSIGQSTDHLPSRHAESGIDALDVSPCSGGASFDGVGLDPTDGSRFGCDTPIPGLLIRNRSVRTVPNMNINATQGAQQSSTSSSSRSIARGGTPMALSGGCLLNQQDHRPSLPRRQHPHKSPDMSSSPRQTAIQHGTLRGDLQLLSLEEQYRGLSENGGAVGGSTPHCSQGGALGCDLPSSSSDCSLTPIGHRTREGLGLPHFGAPLPDPTLPASSSGLPRPPFTPPPHLVTQRPPRRQPSPTSLQEGHPTPDGGSMFALYEMLTRSSESSEAEDDDRPDDWRRALRRFLRRGLRQTDIDKLPSYPLKLEVHGQIFCSVCRSEIENEELVRVLPCKHQFHAASCVDKWLRKNRTCPNCRLCVSVPAPSAPETT